MSDLVRLSFSIERPLYEAMEEMVQSKGYANRSEFIRDMIRDRQVQEQWAEGEEVLGTISLIYDHHSRRLSEKLTDAQHHHHDEVLATTHVHLSHDLCAEMIMVRGAPRTIRQLADRLGGQKGVLHCSLSMGSTGSKLR